MVPYALLPTVFELLGVQRECAIIKFLGHKDEGHLGKGVGRPEAAAAPHHGLQKGSQPHLLPYAGVATAASARRDSADTFGLLI